MTVMLNTDGRMVHFCSAPCPKVPPPLTPSLEALPCSSPVIPEKAGDRETAPPPQNSCIIPAGVFNMCFSPYDMLDIPAKGEP